MGLPIYIVVTPFFPSPDSWRGAYCYDFVCALKRTGRFDVRVFVPGRGLDYDYKGVIVHRFTEVMLPSALFPFLFSYWNARTFIKKVQEVGIKLGNVKVCHGHTAFCSIYPLAVKNANPTCLSLLHHHDPASFGLNQGRFRHFYIHKLINYLLLRTMHNRIDIHVFISQMVKRSFLAVPDTSWSCYDEYHRELSGLKWLKGVNCYHSIVLHNGVDTHLFSRKPTHGQGWTIGCIGNFGDWKSQITLLEASAKLIHRFPELKLRFIGTGECLETCKKYVHEYNLDKFVSFEPECRHEMLPAFFQSLDLFVLPSYFEGFGCVFTEAYACGVPFITCMGQGMDDLVLESERRLWLIPPRDSDALAQQIDYFFKNRPLQHLTGSIDIDSLVSDFVDQIETCNL